MKYVIRKKQRTCVLCKNHEFLIGFKNHECPYKNCSCKKCTITKNIREIKKKSVENARIRKLNMKTEHLNLSSASSSVNENKGCTCECSRFNGFNDMTISFSHEKDIFSSLIGKSIDNNNIIKKLMEHQTEKPKIFRLKLPRAINLDNFIPKSTGLFQFLFLENYEIILLIKL